MGDKNDTVAESESNAALDKINQAMGKTGGFIVHGGHGISYVVRNERKDYDHQFPGCDI